MDQLKRVLAEEEIQKRVKELGKQISKDYQGKSLVLLGILKGAFIFLADLVREINLPDLEIDFVRLASYGREDKTSGKVQITKDLEIAIKDKDVLVVEDIIDTGLTLKYLEDYLFIHRPRSVKICCLIDKTERREIPIKIDYYGFRIPRGFLVGYGLDYAERYRHLKSIYEIVR